MESYLGSKCGCTGSIQNRREAPTAFSCGLSYTACPCPTVQSYPLEQLWKTSVTYPWACKCCTYMSSRGGPSSVCQRQRLFLGVNPPSRGGQRVTSSLLGRLGMLPTALHTSSSWQRDPSHRCSLPSCSCPTGAIQTIPFAFPSLPNASPGFWYPHYWRAVDGRGVSIHLYAVSPLLLQPAPSHTHTVLPFLSTIAKFTKHNRRGTNSEV